MKHIIILLFICSSFIFSEKQKLLFVTDVNFAPYSFKSDDKIVGFDIDIIKEIEKRLDIEIEVKGFPWKRTLKLIESGAAHGGFSLFKTDSREKWSTFTLYPIHKSQFNIFTRKGDEFKYTKVSDLIGKKVGLNRGFAISDKFDQMSDSGEINVIESEGSDTNFKLLQNGRIDCYIGNYFNSLYFLNKNDLRSYFSILPNEIVPSRDAFIVISNKGSMNNKGEILFKINKTLRDMYKDGTYDLIIKQYIGIQ
ncbi:MAG: transporter substrate-binding domain-containing protein [Spirochaetaceae bacterium]